MHVCEIILDDTGVGDIGLQTTVIAAYAEAALGGHRCMTQFACSSERSTVEIAIDHDAKSDTASNSHHQEVMIRLTLAEEFLINRQAINIIIKKDRNSQAVFQGTAD